MAKPASSAKYSEGQILSVDRTTIQGQKLLNGDFSKEYVAVPVLSLNAGLSLGSNAVTLQIQQYHELSRTSFFWALLKMTKRQDWILIYFPVLILLLKNIRDKQFVSVDSIFCLILGLLFLILSLRIKNHVADHLTGIDRLNPETQQEPLMQGKIKVTELNKAAYFTLAISALMSLPFIVQTPLILVFLLPAVVLGLFVQFFNISKFKSDKMGEFFIFCLFGPLYVSGLDMVLIQQVQAETLYIGFYIGLCSVFLLNLRVFSNYLFMAEVHSQNTLIAMGFDRAKNYLQFLMVFLVTAFAFYQFLFISHFWGAISIIVGGLGFWWLSRHLRSCDSPVSSRTRQMKDDLAQIVYGLHLVWIFILLRQVF